jgi:hypothetical protein
MFGRGWERGQATIVERRPLSAGPHGITTRWSYVGDVTPDSGAPVFRATFDDPHLNGVMNSPRPGAVVAVKFNPKNREVKLDRFDASVSSRAIAKQEREAAKARFEAAAKAPPGSGRRT